MNCEIGAAKSNYKKLGPYIQIVNERNSSLEVNTLLGVSIKKCFMPSIANTIGTDMTTYKIIRKTQFAYGPVTSRNGDKISVAFMDELDIALVSQAYTVFEVKDLEELEPEYLMMWFRRTEFDRYARFKSHGSAREIFDWDEMCDTELPIPSIKKQREIVKEYNTVVNRIQLNEQLNQKLEETAQAIYKQWFVDFEFPNEDGKPFKSSGGKLVWNDELDKEIPEGWEVYQISDFCQLSQGIQVDVDLQLETDFDGRLKRFVRIIDYTPKTAEPPRYVDIHDERYFVTRDDIVVIRYGDAGTICRGIRGIIANNLFKVTPVDFPGKNLVYQFLKSSEIQREIRGASASSTMPAITHGAIKQLSFLIPSIGLMDKFEILSSKLEKQQMNIVDEIDTLKDINNVLLSKMTKVEETTEKEMI